MTLDGMHSASHRSPTHIGWVASGYCNTTPPAASWDDHWLEQESYSTPTRELEPVVSAAKTPQTIPFSSTQDNRRMRQKPRRHGWKEGAHLAGHY